MPNDPADDARPGQPRFTQDVDLTVLAPFGSEAALVDALLARFGARMTGARPRIS